MAEAMAVAAAAGMGAGLFGADDAASFNDEAFSATTALVAFLRMEADLAEQKAKRLREQASALAQQFGVSDTLQQQYELDPDQLPPLDENGVPKYKGKKRGRKPKYRKRKPNPNRRKRQHTAYTLFVQETYPGVKAANPNLPSKDVISIVAKQWGNLLSLEEKQEWKLKAVATHHDDVDGDGESASAGGMEEEAVATAAAAAAGAVEDEEEDDEDEDDEDDDDEVDVDHMEEPVAPARRSKRGRT